ncbi:MAG: glycosyltransferase family 2 protein [Nitrospira sp.]|nr:glycosyltransferase family 2 protein [Nitrospira sp.]
MPKLSIIIPARDEAANLAPVLTGIRQILPNAEMLVIDDGSIDSTGQIALDAGASVIRHPQALGNGAAIKAGARIASGDVLVFMDGDGQHAPTDIPDLIEKLESGYSMVVGARSRASQASVGRALANRCYNRLASWMTGQRIEDLTSGFRAVKASRFREFLHLLPNGFSYPTTITMAFFRSGYPVGYVPVVAGRRIGKSHIRPLQDGLRFLLIIFKIGTLYSPIKLFGPISLLFFLLGLGNYIYTFTNGHRFTNMSALLLSASVVVFLIGLISEQITALTYQKSS